MILTNSRHERFAHAVVAGQSLTQAYVEAGYPTTRRQANTLASRLMHRPGVAERIEELQREAAQDCRVDRKGILDFLADLIQPPADGGADAERARISDKLKAVALLTKMCGWDTPPKPEKEAPAGPVEVVVRIGGDAT